MNKENIITQIKKNSTEVYRIYEKEYEGYKFIDVRIYYMDKNSGEYKPTKKGISIMPNNVEEIINGILKAMEAMGFSKVKHNRFTKESTSDNIDNREWVKEETELGNRYTLKDVEMIQQGIKNHESDNS